MLSNRDVIVGTWGGSFSGALTASDVTYLRANDEREKEKWSILVEGGGVGTPRKGLARATSGRLEKSTGSLDGGGGELRDVVALRESLISSGSAVGSLISKFSDFFVTARRAAQHEVLSKRIGDAVSDVKTFVKFLTKNVLSDDGCAKRFC